MEIKKFEDLPVSTSTYMVYSNVEFNLSNIFKSIPVAKITPPLTKKKNIDKKKIITEYGSVVGIQHGIYVRGIRTSKEKKYWCTKCQLLDKSNNREKKIFTVKEYVKPLTLTEMVEGGYDKNTKKLHFVCSECKSGRDPRSIVPFLNQVTIVLSVNNRNINIMTFKNNFKLAGIKRFEDAVETIMITWENYISRLETNWKISNESNKIQFVFDRVMRNVGFKLDFAIDKRKLNSLMNKPEYREMVHLSKCESTSDTHVNIKMYTNIPNNFHYNILTYNIDDARSNPYFTKSVEKLYSKKNKNKNSYITFIVFSSAEIILTGKYDDTMKECYNFFVETTNKYKEEIKEVIIKKETNIIDSIRNIKIE